MHSNYAVRQLNCAVVTQLYGYRPIELNCSALELKLQCDANNIHIKTHAQFLSHYWVIFSSKCTGVKDRKLAANQLETKQKRLLLLEVEFFGKIWELETCQSQKLFLLSADNLKTFEVLNHSTIIYICRFVCIFICAR